ncbi:hypothetical protein VPNG_10116 [Cytospora leucostoma]|uniref:Uncharacterized protein n=1 Tax=Cytospora leucostoma TaxID=1230097 RepID=A0A423VIC5_9PEZI|nr:hypothetical protein VPNG_10116 [Cytospora leucostoma]
MGRTLPWKKGGSTLNLTKSPRTPCSTTSKVSASSPLEATLTRPAPQPSRPAPTSRPKAKQGIIGHTEAPGRSPSPSPPPEPIPEIFMIEGFDNDDQWRMVEDEFYAVAGHFTAHLHAVQYRRLREEARNQNNNALRTIARPVTAPPTSHVKRRQAALALATAQRQGIRTAMSRINVEDTEDEDDEIQWKGTHLAGLMSSPRKKAPPLASMSTAFGVSRAAVSSSQGRHLGSPSASQMASARHHGNLSSTKSAHDHRAVGHIAHLKSSRSRMTPKRAQLLDESGDDDDDLERYSSRQHPTQRAFSRAHTETETLPSSRSRSGLSPAGVISASRELPRAHPCKVSRSSPAGVAPVSNERDSDSGSETYFQRRMRERRSQRKASRHKSSTPVEPSGKDESQNAVLAVPSF